jgi:class 3 adenylate cyclase/tetratricopeptide (TPR) repeat protein
VLAPGEGLAEVRKTVTVLFSDVVGSTALGEELDPESLRRVMSRYFDAMSAVVERYGGMVEKFIGDAIMAVFGLPQVKEDDALRAVHAAADMREELARLNDELERDYGLVILNRTGINTGEVVAGDPTGGQRLVTGDAVNVAARLEQAAAASEILLGTKTHLLVRDSVRVESVEPLELKGKAERVSAYRLLEVLRDAPAFTRRLDASFVGRERSLETLRDELQRCIAERTCRLVTVLGPPGIGKSRLVRELVAAKDDARFVVGRCLPYGEGITYWPLVEIVKQVAGEDARSVAFLLEEEGELVAECIAAAVGQSEAAAAPEETFWAVRKLLEALAHERPLVVGLDDLERAEPTFLDLVEYVLGFATDAPILLLAMARPDLLEHRPSWSAPRPNSTSILLEPLSPEESESLIEQLLAGADLREEPRARILAAAEGNPLFVEQLLALRSEDGDGDTVPPTIQALLAARIDSLEPDERAVIERASVEGRLFHRSAVVELAPPHVRGAVSAHLLALVRKEFIRPDQAEFRGDDAFRFGHILIRDAAYSGMPKELRAELHERFADWLQQKVGEHAREYEEILGYHLEQAYRYRSELGSLDDRARELGRRAGLLLGSAGVRALARIDLPAATNLLERAVDVLPHEDADRSELGVELGAALVVSGDFAQARRVFEESETRAAVAGDERVEWRARVGRAWVQLQTFEIDAAPAQAIVDGAVPALTRLGDDRGLALAWQLAAAAANSASDMVALERAMRQMRAHAERLGDTRLETEAMFWLGLTAYYGPRPLPAAILVCTELAESAATPLQRSDARFWLGACRALGGAPDEIDGSVEEARAVYAELGMRTRHGGTSIAVGLLKLLADDAAGAVAVLEAGAGELAQIGDKGYRSTVLLLLAFALYARQNDAQAQQALAESLALNPDGQGTTMVLALQAIAASEDHKEAERLVRAAVDSVDLSQATQWEAMLLVRIAEVLRRVGNVSAARDALRKALTLDEQKGVTLGVEQTRAALAGLAAT